MFTATINSTDEPDSAPAVDRDCGTWEQAAAHLFAALTVAASTASTRTVTLRYTGAGLVAGIDDTGWALDICGGERDGTLAGEAAAHLAGEAVRDPDGDPDGEKR